MNDKDELLREGKELLKKVQELLDKAEALSKPDPATVCVGDTVKFGIDDRIIIAPPSKNGRVPAHGVMFQTAYQHPLSNLRTLDGRKIDRMVPFRIKRLNNGSWTYHPNGKARGWGHLSDLKSHCSELAKSLWPWYDGPAYVVEE